MIYLSNTFNLKMINPGSAARLSVKPVDVGELIAKLSASSSDIKDLYDKVINFKDNDNLINAINDISVNNIVKSLFKNANASVIGMETGKTTIMLNPKDTLFIVQLTDKIPERDSITLDNFDVNFFEVELICPWKVYVLRDGKEVTRDITFENEMTVSEAYAKFSSIRLYHPMESLKLVPLEKTEAGFQENDIFLSKKF